MIKKILFGMLLIFSSNTMAALFIEDFEDPFPAWESGWLGSNSNIQNVYGVGADRGNNPDGLWIADGLNNGSITEITFDSIFGSSIVDFSIDTTTWVTGAIFEAIDMSGDSILSTTITSMLGGYSDPGSYQTISFSTTNGLSGFSITGGAIEGNTSIDNVVLNTTSVSVPEPSVIALMGAGLIGLGFARRRIKK